MRRRLRLASAAIGAASLALAWQQQQQQEPDEAVRRLTGLASSLPAEFHAHTLLKIAEQEPGLNAAAKLSLVAQAFAVAGAANQPYPRVAIGGINQDSRQALTGKAATLKLDRLSLESRAVVRMAAINGSLARQMFAQIHVPDIPKASCEDPLVPVVDDYYAAAEAVFTRGFTPAEVQRQDDAAFVQSLINRAAAPYHAAPLGRMLAGLRLSNAQFEVALNAYATRLESMTGDDRTFSESAAGIAAAIDALAARAESAQVPRVTLARAYRKFLVTQYSGTRCADSIPASFAGGGAVNPIERFNQSSLRGDLPKIDDKESNAKVSAEKMHVDAFWTSSDSSGIVASLQTLRWSPRGVAYSATDRAGSEWKQQFEAALADIAAWRLESNDSSSNDAFHQKALVYEALIDLAPAGEQRSKITKDFVSFLAAADLQRSNPAEWLWHVQAAFERMRESGDRDAERLLHAYRSSGNVLLEVFADLALRYPQTSVFSRR